MAQQRSTESPSSMKQPLVLALLSDLMLAVRVQATVEALGYRFGSVDSLAKLPETLGSCEPGAVVYDLTATDFPLEETVSLLRSRRPGEQPAPVIAFFPHVMAGLGREARRAELNIVVPRSRFMSDMAALVRSAVQGDSIAGQQSGLNSDEQA